MKATRMLIAVFLLLGLNVPARADFKYTETSQMTGGSMLAMMKFVSKFSRGDAKKQEKEMLQPISTTHYIQGDRLRTDNEDGTSQIIDVAGDVRLHRQQQENVRRCDLRPDQSRNGAGGAADATESTDASGESRASGRAAHSQAHHQSYARRRWPHDPGPGHQ